MSRSTEHHVSARAQPRGLLIVGLSLVLAALATLAWWQHLRIEDLAKNDARDRELPARALSIRRVHGPRFVVAPPRSGRRLMETPLDAHRTDPGLDRAPPGAEFNLARTRPPPLMEDPEFLRAFETYREGMLDARYAGLFRQLNLSPDELAAFKHLLAEKDNLALDVVTISQGLSPGSVPPEVMRAGLQAGRTEVENSIRSALGDARYDQYRGYEDTLAQQATVAQLERRLSYSGAPLTAGQADSLVKVLAQNTPGGSGGTVPAISLVVGADPTGVLPVINPDASGLVTDKAIAQAQAEGLLSAQQIEALREIQSEQQAILHASGIILNGSGFTQQPQINWGLLLQ